MDSNSIRTRLQEIGLNDEQVEEILPLVGETERPAAGGSLPSTEELIIAMQNEPDWRKRASLAARLISNSIEA